jgi:hypothetical protein
VSEKFFEEIVRRCASGGIAFAVTEDSLRIEVPIPAY